MSDTHICLPKLTPLFSLDTWQCGCGKYFDKENATKELRNWSVRNRTPLYEVDFDYLRELVNEISDSDKESPEYYGWKPALLGAVSAILENNKGENHE